MVTIQFSVMNVWRGRPRPRPLTSRGVDRVDRVTVQRMTRDPRHREGLHPADQRTLSNIETHGWNVTKVFRSEGETGPEWAFSAGLFHSYQHPEIVIFGLDLEVMHKIVNNLGDEVKKGKTFGPGKEYQEIFARCGCWFRPVQQRYYKEYLGLDNLVLRGRPISGAAMFLARQRR